MHVQNQIKRSLRDAIVEVARFIDDHPTLSRNAIARELCQRYHFLDTRNCPQHAGCLKALRELADEGLLALPAPRMVRRGPSAPRRLGHPVPLPRPLPESVELIDQITFTLVQSEEHFRIWNELMLREHPFGDRKLVGRQLRYLIESEHGYLAAAGFSSAALRLRDRDQWIGWSPEQRRDHLDRVVSLSRLLLRTGTQPCANLASTLLSRLCEHFSADFKDAYHYAPWLLETFVERRRFRGTCYRAAGWTHVGATTGRSRNDRDFTLRVPVKDIFVYPLSVDFRRRLCT